jgi:thioesterase domain-containing protein
MNVDISNEPYNQEDNTNEPHGQPSRPLFSPLVLLKAGRKVTPIYLFHGLDGSIDKFAELVKHIESDNPIYGIQAKGVDGLQEPFDRVEDMARYYMSTIMAIQPHGPYVFIGYSFGGLVAFELARLLSERGEKIALLAMVAAYPHLRQLPIPQRMRVLARRGGHRAYEVGRMSVKEAAFYCNRRMQSRLRSPESMGGDVSNDHGFLPGDIVRAKARIAIKQYRPRFYDGKIKFIKIADDYYFPSNPAAVWGEWAAELETETLPGDHLGIINTDFEKLAPVLSRYLAEVFKAD